MKTVIMLLIALTSTFMQAMEQESPIQAQTRRRMSSITRQYQVLGFVAKAERFIKTDDPITEEKIREFFKITDPLSQSLETAGIPLTAPELIPLKNRLLQLKEEDPNLEARIKQFLAIIQALVAKANGTAEFVAEFTKLTSAV